MEIVENAIQSFDGIYILQTGVTISSTFYVRVQKCFFCQNVTGEKLRKALSYIKPSSKMLMKLTPVLEKDKRCWEKNS